MCWTATLIFGLMALSGVLAYRVSPGSRWSSGPLDPSNIKRHNYVFSEFCPMYPRNMSFGDEIIVSSQRHWQDSYKTGVNCTMFINIDSPDLGLIVSLLTEETPDCQDYLELSPSQSDKLKYCGLKTNETGNTYNYMNESMVLNWYVPKRGENERHKGFSIMFTAFQYDCKTGQTCFPCENGLIIDQVHMCNGYNNCGDNTDEWDYPSNNPPRPPHPTPEPGPTPEPSPRMDTGSSTGMIIVSVLLFGAVITVAGLAYLSSKFLRERNHAPTEGLEECH